MIEFTESYTKSQLAVIAKLKELYSVLEIVSFSIENYPQDIYQLSESAALEAMKVLGKRLEATFKKMKEETQPKLNLDMVLKIKIDVNRKPMGTKVPVDDFIGLDFRKDKVNVRDYSNPRSALAYALLEPPYSLQVKIDAMFNSEEYFQAKAKEYTQIYKSFVYGLLNITDMNRSSVTVYRWSNDWSSYFDAGKDWWGTYFWTIYNSETNTIIVIGGSSTD